MKKDKALTKSSNTKWIMGIIILCCIIFTLTGCTNKNENANNTPGSNSEETNSSSTTNVPNGKVYYSYTSYTESGMASNIGTVQVDSATSNEISLDGTYSVQYADGYLYVLKDNNIYRGTADLKNSFVPITNIDSDYINRFFVYNGKIYYSKDNTNGSDDIYAKLAVMNVDGSSASIIDEYIPDQMVADKDGLFAVSMDAVTERKITKFDLNGGNKTVLESDSVAFMTIAGEYIYYTNIDDNFNLYRIKKDGTNKTKILDNKLDYTAVISNQNEFFGVIGEYVYYINKNDNNKIYKVKTDGTGNSVIVDTNVSKLCVKDNYLYYSVSYGKDAGLHCADTTGKEIKKILNKNVDSFVVE